MRVVLDTNVIVAAFAARGLCAEVFEVCVSGHSIILGEHILEETREKLLKKVKLPKKDALSVIDYLRGIAEIVNPVPLNMSICRDEDDTKIIGTAIGGSATCIVTGDEDLLVLKAYQGVKIVTPRQFWASLRGQ
jgi:putative PIN family toxin of toxin-antitoxin system